MAWYLVNTSTSPARTGNAMKIKHLPIIWGLFTLLGGALSAQPVLNPVPYKVVGQYASPATLTDTLSPTQITPNLVEGKEFFRLQSVAVDTSLDPPALWVADTANNRVLGFRNAREASGVVHADIVLGQKNFNDNFGLSPTASYPSGLNTPTSVAVDKFGNVFVADAGNNRILRFPSPFQKKEEGAESFDADLVVGQRSLLANAPNQSTASNTPPTEFTIRTSVTVSGGGRTIYNVSLYIDREGHLWFTDAGNHRVLRYASEAVSGPGNIGAEAAATEIPASLCIGQEGYTTAVANPARVSQPNDRLEKKLIRSPSAVTLDDSGNVYVSDDLGRVLVYPATENGVENRTEARRLMGILILGQNPDEPVTRYDATRFGLEVTSNGQTFNGGPRGLFTINNRVYVIDTLYHRILRFPPYAEWPSETERYSPKAEAVFGQDGFDSATFNRWDFSEPSAKSFFSPISAALADGKLFLADSQNNRVLIFPNLGDIPNEVAPNTEAERLLGQFEWGYRAPNVTEGREFAAGSVTFTAASGGSAAFTVYPSAAVDYTGETPRLFVADPGNNRVLAFSDYYRLEAGNRADFAIGQVDLSRVLVNSPLMNPNLPTRQGLFTPAGVAVDKAGNLYIADTGNGRVLRYPKPFEKWLNGEPQEADLVIGQPDFESRGGEVGPGRLFRPTSLTITEAGKLVVADPLLNRVLVFVAAAVTEGVPEFTSGQEATKVLGQPDFTSVGAGNGADQLSFPLHVAADIDSRVYVADANNNRVVIFGSIDSTDQPSTGATSVFSFSLGSTSAISAVAVNRANGRIWVGDSGTYRASGSSWTGQRAVRLPDYFSMAILGNTAIESQVASFGPRSLLVEKSNGLMVFDSANRATFHYPVHEVRNYASGSPRVTANLIADLRAPAVSFSSDLQEHNDAPWPRQLADVEVLVNGVSAPITKVEREVVRFMVPRDVPSTGRTGFTVRRHSTGEVLAHNTVQMYPESPAIIPVTIPGGGMVRALNQDGSENTASNPARPGQEVTLLMIGYGSLPNAPEEGTAPGEGVAVDGRMVIAIGTGLTDLISSTLDPNSPGVWRVKTRIPDSVACPSTAPSVPVGISWRDVSSRIGPTGSPTLVTTLNCRNP